MTDAQPGSNETPPFRAKLSAGMVLALALISAGTLGTALATSTLPAMASVGFLSGAGASLAEQCAEARMTGKAVAPLSMARQALTDGVVGGGRGDGSLDRGGDRGRGAQEVIRGNYKAR